MGFNLQQILLQRKEFISDTYQFYTQHSDLLDELKNEIFIKITEDVENVAKLLNKWQKKLLRLNRFNEEIASWMKSQKDKELNPKQIIEISYLKSSFEKQNEEAEKHYHIFLSEIQNKKNKWKEEIALYLIRTINKNSSHNLKKQKIDSNLSFLKKYCHEWKTDNIEELKSIIFHSKELQSYCEILIQDIESAKSTESVDMLSSDPNINYLSSLKNSRVIANCEELSGKLLDFKTLYNFEALSSKLNMSYPQLREMFIDSFSDNSMSGMRASLKIIKKLTETESKILNIQKKLHKIETIFLPHYQNLKERKVKMLELCLLSQQLEEQAAFRWIDNNLDGLFSPIDEIFKQ